MTYLKVRKITLHHTFNLTTSFDNFVIYINHYPISCKIFFSSFFFFSDFLFVCSFVCFSFLWYAPKKCLKCDGLFLGARLWDISQVHAEGYSLDPHKYYFVSVLIRNILERFEIWCNGLKTFLKRTFCNVIKEISSIIIIIFFYKWVFKSRHHIYLKTPTMAPKTIILEATRKGETTWIMWTYRDQMCVRTKCEEFVNREHFFNLEVSI